MNRIPEATKPGPIKNLTKEFINKAESLGEEGAMMRPELNYFKLSKHSNFLNKSLIRTRSLSETNLNKIDKFLSSELKDSQLADNKQKQVQSERRDRNILKPNPNDSSLTYTFSTSDLFMKNETNSAKSSSAEIFRKFLSNADYMECNTSRDCNNVLYELMYERYLREEYEAKMRTYVIYKMKYDQLSMSLNKLDETMRMQFSKDKEMLMLSNKKLINKLEEYEASNKGLSEKNRETWKRYY